MTNGVTLWARTNYCKNLLNFLPWGTISHIALLLKFQRRSTQLNVQNHSKRYSNNDRPISLEWKRVRWSICLDLDRSESHDDEYSLSNYILLYRNSFLSPRVKIYIGTYNPFLMTFVDDFWEIRLLFYWKYSLLAPTPEKNKILIKGPKSFLVD